MSVGFARAVEQGLRHNGVPVSFEPGWESRGNGQSFPNGKPLGLITHHTGADYGAGLSILVKGRSDLPGPLCNCSTYPDGRIHIIAAHPANHAGASGGRSMGPLPTTTLFNRVVWGNEVMFPGTKPWTPQQYRSARVLAGVICGILGYRNAEHCRSHAETSRTGKWDPGAGRGPGIPFDMASFRRNVWAALHQPTGDDDMSAEAEKLIREMAPLVRTIHHESTLRLPDRIDYRYLGEPEPDPDDRWKDTVAGRASSADARAYESRRTALQAKEEVQSLRKDLPGMITAAVRAVLAEERKP